MAAAGDLTDDERRALRESKFAPLPDPTAPTRPQPRMAHPEGPLTTNKSAALAKFLDRKLQQPDGLDSLNPDLVKLAVKNAKETIKASKGTSFLSYHCHTCHHQAQCTSPTLCYACKKSGHISLKCPLLEGQKEEKVDSALDLCGFGIPGQAFYYMHIDVPEVQSVKSSVTGILTVEEGSCSEAKITIEMKRLFEIPWDWSVRQIDRDQFLVEFPSKEIRRKLTRF